MSWMSNNETKLPMKISKTIFLFCIFAAAVMAVTHLEAHKSSHRRAWLAQRDHHH